MYFMKKIYNNNVFFRDTLLEEAVQFEAWPFLEKHLKWWHVNKWWWRLRQAKARALKQDKELEKAKKTTLRQTKIFQLSRVYPAFNEDALPEAKLGDSVQW